MVFTASIQRGFSAGWRVAVAPLITDAPIIALALLAVGALPDGALQVMGISGGVAVMAFGVREAIGARRWAPADDSSDSADLWRGVVANVLSPNAWLFWFIVGAPIIVEAWKRCPRSCHCVRWRVLWHARWCQGRARCSRVRRSPPVERCAAAETRHGGSRPSDRRRSGARLVVGVMSWVSARRRIRRQCESRGFGRGDSPSCWTEAWRPGIRDRGRPPLPPW